MAILLLFITNWKTIRKTVDETGFVDRVVRRVPESDSSPSEGPESPEVIVLIPENETPPPISAADSPADTDTVLPAVTADTEPVKSPPDPADPNPAKQPTPPAAAPAPKSAERSIYFIKFDEENGVPLRIRVSRTLPISDSPLRDTLDALLRGPTAAEKNQKLQSLIPPETRILNVEIRGSTAYINFNENFQFNSYSTEGYVAQLQQLVWTTTEFSNIDDVQFLIEGRRVDYLGENIQIGGPLSRNSFWN